MTLRLTLKAGERVAINGAVVVNGDRRTSFAIENQAQVLREKDIMRPEEADSPAKRLYLAILMLALDPENRLRHRAAYESRITEFTAALSDRRALSTCARLAAAVANRELYQALSLCRTLIDFERTRLHDVA